MVELELVVCVPLTPACESEDETLTLFVEDVGGLILAVADVAESAKTVASKSLV